MSKQLVRKLLERNPNQSMNQGTATTNGLIEETRDLQPLVGPVRRLLTCRINKKSLNLLRIGLIKDYPKLEEVGVDLFDNIFN